MNFRSQPSFRRIKGLHAVCAVAGGLLALGIPAIAIAQDASAPAVAPAQSAPAATPATSQRAPYRLTVPQGFEIKEMAGRRFLIEAADVDWVTQAVQGVQPTTRPTTMPADLVTSLQAHREQLQQQIIADLGLADASLVNEQIDKQWIPLLERFEKISPPIYFMPVQRSRLKQLLKDGWTNPRFKYNRAMDDVLFDMRMTFATDRQMDDSIIPMIFEDSESDTVKNARITDTIQALEAYLQSEVSTQAQLQLQLSMIAFLEDQIGQKVRLKTDQVWFRIGLASALSCQYAATVTGVSADTLTVVMCIDPLRPVVRSGPIDLLHPTKISDLKPEVIDQYADALRRKSTRVMSVLVRKHRTQVAAMLQQMSAKPPVSGQELLEEIQQATGVDLSAKVRPIYGSLPSVIDQE